MACIVRSTLFEVDDGSAQWILLAIPLLVGGLLVAVYLLRYGRRVIIAGGIVGGAVALCFVMLFGTVLPNWSLIKTVKSGKYEVVEGFVSNFRPQAGSRRQPESFSVSGVTFSYSQSSPSVAFNWTFGNGGPIREGLHVRVGYVDGRIVRLEECY